MTMLAKENGGAVLALADYEARILLYKEQIGTGYIGIGKTLQEAKDAGVVPHGQWESWVERTTGLTIRQAQRCMQAAAEIGEGSQLARLEMSKALMLLSSGLDRDEQEEIAKAAADEGATVRELREELARRKAEADETIRGLKKQVVENTGAAADLKIRLREAEASKQDLEAQMEATMEAFREQIRDAERKGADGARKDAEEEARKQYVGKIEYINSQRRIAEAQIAELKKDLKEAGQARWNEGYRIGQEELNAVRAELQRSREAGDALQAELDAAEARERKRAEELSQLKREKAQDAMNAARGIGGDAVGAVDLSAAVRAFIGAAGVIPQMGAAMAGMSAKEREVIEANIRTVEKWVDGSLAALGTIRADGDVR